MTSPNKHQFFQYSFANGYNPDGGPFFTADAFVRDGKNTAHDVTGAMYNRPGVELLQNGASLVLTDVSSATQADIYSTYYAELAKLDGTLLKVLFLRCGQYVQIFANDGVTYTNSLANLTINHPDFSYTLLETNQNARYYKSGWAKDGNTIILSNSKTPLVKFIWGKNPAGIETFTAYRIALSEISDDLFDLSRAADRGRSFLGWYSVDVNLQTGVTDYIVDEYIISAAPGYEVTVFLVDANGNSTYVAPANFIYSETYDTTINDCVASVHYTGPAITGTSLRVYFGQTTLLAQNPALQQEEAVISAFSKDYSANDNSYAPKLVAQFAGRDWFAGLDGPIDGALQTTYPSLGYKYKRLWVAPIFTQTVYRQENSNIACKPVRFPFDINDNTPTAADGGTIDLDNAGAIKALAPYGNSMFCVADNGVWAITGPNDYFDLSQIIQKKVIDMPISCNAPLVSTESGLFIFADSEVFLIDATNQQQPITKLAQNRISSFYNQIPVEAKRAAFTRYDSHNKRVYFWFTRNATKLSYTTYNTYAMADEYLCYDIKTSSWFTPGDLTLGEWSVIDMTTIPADTYFDPSDSRYSKYNRVNLVTLAAKAGDYTAVCFGILEGKPYCADYVGTTYEIPFQSYMETTNSFGKDTGYQFARSFGVGEYKAISRMYVHMVRQEQSDAGTDGYYTYPGAVYMWRRWGFADKDTAGPLRDAYLDAGQDARIVIGQQIYFPDRYGQTVIGGGQPSMNVIQYESKIRGRGNTMSFKFGNNFGDTDLTGTIQEQKKGWGVYGYQLNVLAYDYEV